MIKRLIYDILSQDSIDDSQAAKEAELIKRYPSITDFSQFSHYWLSLQTLLGDSSPEWASKKIKYSQREDAFEQITIDDDELPVIAISEQAGFEPEDTSYVMFRGSICLNIQTALDSDSLEAFKMYTRIKEYLFPFKDGIVLNQRCFDYPNSNINRLILKLNRLENLCDNRLKVYLDARFQLI
jgi:hypothetical protein